MPAQDVAKITEAAVTMMQATRAEVGCIEYEFAEVIGSPGTIRVYERWESVSTLLAHFDAPHMADWQKAMATVTISSRQLARYEGIDEIIPL